MKHILSDKNAIQGHRFTNKKVLDLNRRLKRRVLSCHLKIGGVLCVLRSSGNEFQRQGANKSKRQIRCVHLGEAFQIILFDVTQLSLKMQQILKVFKLTLGGKLNP